MTPVLAISAPEGLFRQHSFFEVVVFLASEGDRSGNWILLLLARFTSSFFLEQFRIVSLSSGLLRLLNVVVDPL